MKTLRFILGDQLNSNHSWFQEVNEDVVYCMIELHQEMNYVKHHIQKVVGFLLAMRAFNEALKVAGHQTIYKTLNDNKKENSLTELLAYIITEGNFEAFQYQEPDEYRLEKQLDDFSQQLSVETTMFSTEHFYTDRTDFGNFFKNKKTFLMESFYREMRKRFNILMKNGNPIGGEWNYDQDNRNKWTTKSPEIPKEKKFNNDASEIIKMLEKHDIKTFGSINKKEFNYPIDSKQAKVQLTYFCNNLLQYFGDYQDAMHTEASVLFHSKLSFALNTKQISAATVVEAVTEAFHKSDNITINQAEGFVRQVIGWREYMRGLYWLKMPEYKELNYFNHNKPLPKFFWDGKTKMNCLKHAINDSLNNAYAHHIQRLMVIGNYALLTERSPDVVDDWYLGVYIDAIEWVQLPNTRGMSQFADGGIIATKPYVSSGNYINKMSNYCNSCQYNLKTKTATDSCPFNSLYWNFLDENREKLSNNRRMKMMYHHLDKLSYDTSEKIKTRANHIINNPDDY